MFGAQEFSARYIVNSGGRFFGVVEGIVNGRKREAKARRREKSLRPAESIISTMLSLMISWVKFIYRRESKFVMDGYI